MSEDCSAILTDVFSDILENQTFMFSDALEEIPDYPGPSIMVNIRFTGPFEGTLSMAISVELSAEVAANMLGLEPEDELAEHRANDAVKELLNVACGHVLTELAGEEPVFDLAVPTITPLDEIAWAQHASADGSVALSVEDSPIVVRLVKH